MEWLWTRDLLLLLGWTALMLAPLAHGFCWIAARTCAVLLAFAWVFVAFCEFGSHLPLQFTDSSWTLAMADSTVARNLVLVQFQIFNLFVASWQVEDSKRHDIAHIWLLPGLVATAAVGPLGLIVHMAIRDSCKIRKARAAGLE